MTTHLLVVEDEEAIREMIRFSFSSSEFTIHEAENNQAAMHQLEVHPIDVLLLDWMLPGGDGIQFIQWIKKQDSYSNIPIILLTAKVDEASKVKALSTGADDYVTKPFSPAELKARIDAILRRGVITSPSGTIRHGPITINKSQHSFEVSGKPITLTPTEFKLLYVFMTHPNKTLTREHLLNMVWRDQHDITDRSVDVHMRRLRNKLKETSCEKMIKTIRHSGYQFDPDMTPEK